MKYIDTAFSQLAFAWKLYNYALEGRINLDELDRPITFQEGEMVFALPDKIFNGPDDLILAFENNLSVAFGAAAITLNRCREEAGVKLTDPIQTEIDNFSSVVYQIRNAFAHDISEPRWNISNPRYARVYEFGGIRIDLSQVGTKVFEYADIGGPDALFWMKDFGDANVWC
ncbi:hypothetical protein [Duganella hordei]|uniref:hypothetical protein n=1 Tax=Duganella hordei TaxID=2865934 RepID=UPI0030EAF934